jgi:glutaryl-CoA dehydrogenase
VDGGYLITGEKRWIGNGTIADYIIVWAKNESEGGKI